MARTTITADVINATTSFADITGLSFTVRNGSKYRFRAHIWYIPNATTTGVAFSVNTAATVTQLATASSTPVTATTQQVNFASAVDTGTSSTDSLAGANLGVIEGLITAGTDGVLTMRFKSEVAVASGITVKAGSTVEWVEL